MKNRLEPLFWFILENGPSALTVIFAAYVIYNAQVVPSTQISTDVTLQWILALLGLLAISELVERMRKLKRIEDTSTQTLEAVLSRFAERPGAESFFMKQLPPLESYIETADSISMFGVALQRTIRENLDVLAKRLAEGAEIRLVIVDPDGMAAQQIANPARNFPLEALKANSELSLHNIRWLHQLPQKEGTIQLKLTDEEPYFNIIGMDMSKTYGRIFIELYPQRRLDLGARPRFELQPERDRYWFTYFRQQFEALWNDSALQDVVLDEVVPKNKKESIIGNNGDPVPVGQTKELN